MTRFVPGLLLLSALLLAGCATTSTPTAPVPAAPVSPSSPKIPATPTPGIAPAPVAAPVAEAKPATITGSEESSVMFDSFTAYVAAVDGRPVPAGRQGWNTPLALPAGSHWLTVQFNRGVFAARTELSLTAAPAAAYQLKFATDAEIFGRNSYCEFWVVETGSDKPVTKQTRVPLTRIEQPK